MIENYKIKRYQGIGLDLDYHNPHNKTQVKHFELEPAVYSTHVLVVGDTGQGKTNTLFELIRKY